MMFWLIVLLACWWGFFGGCALIADTTKSIKVLVAGSCAVSVYVLFSYAVTLR